MDRVGGFGPLGGGSTPPRRTLVMKAEVLPNRRQASEEFFSTQKRSQVEDSKEASLEHIKAATDLMDACLREITIDLIKNVTPLKERLKIVKNLSISYKVR